MQYKKKYQFGQQNESKIPTLRQQMLFVYQQIKLCYAPYLIYMVTNNRFNEIFSKLVEIMSQNMDNENKQIINIAGKIIYIENQLLPKIFQNNFEQYQEFVKKNKIMPVKVDKQQYTGQSNFCSSQFLNIARFAIEMKQSNEIKKIPELNEMKLTFRKFEVKQKNMNEYEQIAINWIRNRFNEFPSNSRELMCCKMCFYADMQINTAFRRIRNLPKNINRQNYGNKQEENQQIQKRKQKQDLARLICSYLNDVGGVVITQFDFKNYMQNVNPNIIKGTPLTLKQKQFVINYIKQCINIIKPKHKQFQIINQQFKIKQQIVKHKINYYFQIQFIPVMKKCFNKFDKYLFQKFQQKYLYVCKIFIKKGHPKHTYYIVQSQRQGGKPKIKFFMKQGQKSKTLQMMYDQIYRKLQNYKAQRSKNSIPNRGCLHGDCIIDMSMTKEQFDIDQESDGDSDDDESDESDDCNDYD